MTTTDAAADERAATGDTAARPASRWAWFGFGAASGVIGLLPWIITGMRLPLQNLWADGALPEQMPIVLLPFSQYAVTLVAGILVVQSAIAGLVARSTRARQPRGACAAVAAGVLLVQVVAIAQTAATVAGGLREGRDSAFYLAAVIAVAVASVAVGSVVLIAIGRMPRAGALVGLGIASVGAGWWIDAVGLPFGAFATPAQLAILPLLPWIPAILGGIAIAWCGLGSVGRVVAAIVVVAALVIGPAFATAVTSAAGTRVLLPYPAEMLDYGVQVFRSALSTPELTARPVVTALVVAAIGFAVKRYLRRRVARRHTAS